MVQLKKVANNTNGEQVGLVSRTPLGAGPPFLDQTTFPPVGKPFILTGRWFMVACFLFNCCSFLFNRMMSSVKGNHNSDDKQGSLNNQMQLSIRLTLTI